MEKTKHRNTVEFKVYGKYAMFTDVLTRTGGERFSYMIPTYEALKGILHSIYWKPTILWKIDSVRVMNPIKTVRKGIRPIKYSGGNDLAYYTYLEDVCYQVRAHFEWNMNRPELESDRNEHKHHNKPCKSCHHCLFFTLRPFQHKIENRYNYACPCDFKNQINIHFHTPLQHENSCHYAK